MVLLLVAFFGCLGAHHPLNFFPHSSEIEEESVEEEEVDIIVIEDEESPFL